MTSQPRTKVMIATPIYGGAEASYVSGMVNLLVLAEKSGLDCSYVTMADNPCIDRARNMLADIFLRSDCTHLLFIDDDIGFEPAQVIDFIQRMAADEKLAVFGGPCPRRMIAWKQVHAAARAGLAMDDPEGLEVAGGQYAMEPLDPAAPVKTDEPFELLRLGTGMMAIRRDVLETLREAHPELLYNAPEGEQCGGAEGRQITAFFHPLIEPDTRNFRSDDFAFCNRVRDAGFRIWAAPWMRLSHTGPATFSATITDLAALQSQARKTN
ncbi:MAG: hypothetical protein ABJM58_01350 [Alteripontixanthobacter sp.]